MVTGFIKLLLGVVLLQIMGLNRGDFISVPAGFFGAIWTVVGAVQLLDAVTRLRRAFISPPPMLDFEKHLSAMKKAFEEMLAAQLLYNEALEQTSASLKDLGITEGICLECGKETLIDRNYYCGCRD